MATVSEILEQKQQPQSQPQGFNWRNYVSEAGGLAGGLLGSLAGGVGAVGGATVGAGLGQALESKLLGQKQSARKIAGEAVMSGAGELIGLGVGKLATGLLSKGTSKAATGLIKKAYKPTATAIRKSAFNSTDDFAKFVIKNNKNLSDEAIAALQNQYDDLAINSGAKVNVNKLYDSLVKEASKISKEGGTKKIKFAEQIKAEADLLKSQLKGGKADISTITNIRRSFDENVKNFGADELTDVSLWMRNRLKNTIDTAANSAAAKVDGKTITEISKQLSKSISARDLIAKGLEKGSTRSPFGMGAIGGGVIGGGAFGGTTGALGGAAVGSAMNNPALVGGTAGLLGNIATKTAGGMGRTAGNVAGSLGQLNMQTGQGLAESVTQPTDQVIEQPAVQPISAYITPQGQMPESRGMTDKDFFTQAIFNDFAQTGGKNVSQIMAVAKFLGVDQAGTTTKKTEAQTARDDAAYLAQDALDFFTTNKIKSGLLNAPIQENLAKLGIADQPTVEFQTKVAQLKATIAKARAGTSFTPNEERLLNQYTPQLSDSPQQIKTKLKGLVEFFGNRPNAGSTSTDQLGTLLQQYSSQ